MHLGRALKQKNAVRLLQRLILFLRVEERTCRSLEQVSARRRVGYRLDFLPCLLQILLNLVCSEKFGQSSVASTEDA